MDGDSTWYFQCWQGCLVVEVGPKSLTIQQEENETLALCYSFPLSLSLRFSDSELRSLFLIFQGLFYRWWVIIFSLVSQDRVGTTPTILFVEIWFFLVGGDNSSSRGHGQFWNGLFPLISGKISFINRDSLSSPPTCGFY